MSTLHNRGPPAAWQGPEGIKVELQKTRQASVSYAPVESVNHPPGRSCCSSIDVLEHDLYCACCFIFKCAVVCVQACACNLPEWRFRARLTGMN